jgi:IclR family acetate operon transcriptional repressor
MYCVNEALYGAVPVFPKVADQVPIMGADKTDSGVKGAMRTLDLFEAFAKEGRALSLSQLAKLLDVPVSSCHQLVGTLEARGYLYAVGRRKEIYPSGKLLGVARALVAHDTWVRAAGPYLQNLRDVTRETIILGKRQGYRVIYLAIEEGTEPVRFTAQVGDRKPLHFSAIGRALLAELDDRALRDTLRGLGDRYPKSLSGFDQEKFVAELMRSRERGWYSQRGGSEVDVMAISASFAVADDMFAISVAGPHLRIAKSESSLISKLLNTRDSICKMLADRFAPSAQHTEGAILSTPA